MGPTGRGTATPDSETEPDASQPTERQPLSRDVVLSAALELLDEGSDTTLSRRRLAQHLGVSTMATYHYVPDEGYLREGLAELLAEELQEPAPGRSWQEAMSELAWSFRDMVDRHPAAFRFVLSGGWPEAFISIVVHAADCIRAAGYEEERAERMSRSLARVLIGSAVVEQGGFGDPIRPLDRDLAEANFRFAVDSLIRGMAIED